MEIIGTKLIPSPRELVWKALNDPEILKACLPGCESVEKLSDTDFKVTIKTAIGPLRARFQGSLKMEDVNAPESCVMQFEGQGGAVGFGKGSSKVQLIQTAQGTELSYEAKAQVGGKLAQVGSRLIDSVAKKMTDDFFKAFQEQLNPNEAKTSVKASTPSSQNTPRQAPEALSQPANPAQSPTLPTAIHTHQHPITPMVPAWWLAPACVLGALIAITAARWLY
jgi:carbon monoxide dehydrogenase subunit G